MSYKHRVLLGGLGDDAHTVGLKLLEIGLRESGYHVYNINIRNDIPTFFSLAKDYDVIMISSVNGHSDLYLKDFPQLLGEFNLVNYDTKLWYIGGNLSVSEPIYAVKKKYYNIGFNGVYPKPVGLTQVLEDLKRDLYRHEIRKKKIYQCDLHERPVPDLNGHLKDEAINFNELIKLRNDLLKETPEYLLDQVGEFSNPFSNKSSLCDLLWSNKVLKKKPLLQPRTGVADLEKQIDILLYLEKSGSHISSVQLDAASRSKFFKSAFEGVQLSKGREGSALNGFPVPVHGVKGMKKLLKALSTPFQLRAGGPDHRLVYEIALQSGVSALEGGPICYLMPYDKTTSPVDSINFWQYIDRLCALYQDKYQLNLNREYFGVLTATLIEPSLAIIVNIVQAILSAKQGIRSITVGYAEQGNRSQDIAAIRALEELTIHYLKIYGFHHIRITTVFHQYMAAFPREEPRSEELIFESSVTATLAESTKMMVKTPVEALRIPNKYDNARALNICKRGQLYANKNMIDEAAVNLEKMMIKKCVSEMFDAIIEIGNGEISQGLVKAFYEGLIDIPWSPNIYNRGEVVTLRDLDGAIRFDNFGNLPLSEDIKEFHYEKIALRKNMERESSIFQLLESDLSRIWKNEFLKWPLDGTYVY